MNLVAWEGVALIKRKGNAAESVPGSARGAV